MVQAAAKASKSELKNFGKPDEVREFPRVRIGWRENILPDVILTVCAYRTSTTGKCQHNQQEKG